ncbi:P-loop containing nucleoside triphosphate hydrolase protein [Protomyces lactucae-debilis]|uniref:p-loop containing nucleoside triphosphate hydrolase protein n=1 Tax=Protomyces lactucae-debilis TaxID=2754530 RepID=A0A1Y2FNC8_PROLT|nr:P-loop containing nucleoside triphosphate hydrolase protein [Protomyces lactucae-debilis]ORY85097.1 P-loop containing nucleoside triphosphate hydrolase protein [Protomyces lactucae-debilis]
MAARHPSAVVSILGPAKPHFTGVPPNEASDVILDEAKDIYIPAETAKWLREYQLVGVQFLYDAYKSKSGVILGDDMGLGKTAQCIVFLNAIFGKKALPEDMSLMRDRRDLSLRHPRVLVLCPKSLISNWLAEFDIWSYTHTRTYSGPGRGDTLAQAKQGRLEVMLATYESYRSDCDQINLVPWDLVIADEFHCIKNLKSALRCAFSKMDKSLNVRIGLSGTPIQNRLSELFSLLSWLRPETFDSEKAFESNYSRPIKLARRQDCSNAELAAGDQAAMQLRDVMQRIMLRRLKSLLADQLPNKTDLILFCPLTTAQAEVYDRIAQSTEVRSLCQTLEASDESSETRVSVREKMFLYITLLRTIPQHLALLFPASEDSAERRAAKTNLLDIALPGTWQALAARGANLNERDESFCGKWLTLCKLLRLWHAEGTNKVLIFSSSVRLLDMLESFLQMERYTFEVLNGRMSAQERDVAVDAFSNGDRFLFLISTGVGSVGINLQSANKVVIYSPSWNPSSDLQAMDRAYRIGQRRDVEVYRLIAVGTIEELIYARQIYKQQVADIVYNEGHQRRYFTGVMDDKERHGELFGLRNLLTYHGENHVTRDIFKKTSVAERRFDLDLSISEFHLPDIPSSDLNGPIKDERAELEELLAEDDKPARKKAISSTAMQTITSNNIAYIQSNAQALESSDVAARMESRAVARANDPDWANRRADGADEQASQGHQIGTIPRDVLQRHFGKLAAFKGYKDTEQFALKVTEMSYKEKAALLKEFYAHRKQQQTT